MIYYKGKLHYNGTLHYNSTLNVPCHISYDFMLSILLKWINFKLRMEK